MRVFLARLIPVSILKRQWAGSMDAVLMLEVRRILFVCFAHIATFDVSTVRRIFSLKHIFDVGV